jgi:hypothetical protein
MSRLSLVIFSVAAFCLYAPAVAIVNPPASSAEQTLAIQHQKLADLLDELDGLERNLSSRLDELTATGKGIDVGNIYQGINLGNVEGIHTARQRVSIFTKQMDEFGVVLENYWARIAEKVKATDLDEPLASQLKEQLSLDQSNVYPNFRAWILAAREDAEAVTHYLDVNEHYLGQFQMTDNTLSFTDPRVPADLSKAQSPLLAAEEHDKRASRAALQNPVKIIKFVLSALREMEKGMTKREDANEESGSEKKAK